jgi:hypothetical protein
MVLKWGIVLLLIPASAQEISKPHLITFTILDESANPVTGAILTIQPQYGELSQLTTNSVGQAFFALRNICPCHVHVEKSGYFASDLEQSDSAQAQVNVQLKHVQMVLQSVDVNASTIEPDAMQLADKHTMSVQDIVNIPYPTSRDIRQILQYLPGVIADRSGRAHIAGSEQWAVLDTLDDFDIRSPFDGSMAMRFSADAIRSIDKEGTRIPVEYGRNTGGVIAFHTGTGDDRLRFNITDFMPQFEELNGLRFDKFVPRVTFSGPIKKNQAWFFDGIETEFLQHYVPQLPRDQRTDFQSRGSNMFRLQWNSGPQTVIKAALLFNDMHTPYEGLNVDRPRQSTVRHNTIAWFPYVRIQQGIGRGMLDAGVGVVRFGSHSVPHSGSGVFTLRPEGSTGSYFQSVDNVSQSVQTNASYYLPPSHWAGLHHVKAGVEMNELRFQEFTRLEPIRYLRENHTLLRMSTFTPVPAFSRHNLAAGAFIEDHWSAGRLLLEPGVRMDWNEITRHPVWSPRIAAVVIPNPRRQNTKLAAGIGIYFEQTLLEFLQRALLGPRADTYYTANGLAPLGPPVVTAFTYDPHSLRDQYAINWSLGLEQRLPGAMLLKANYIHKHVYDAFVYTGQAAAESPSSLEEAGRFGNTYRLTNNRQDVDTEFDVDVRKNFGRGYSFDVAYARTMAHTNAAIDYQPTVSYVGPQQAGPLPWDSPNHITSYGWFPVPLSRLAKRWDFGYTFNWHTGFPYTAVNANDDVVGQVNGYRFPNYMALNPGIEWKFHFHDMYFGLRTVIENVTNAADPFFVNNNVDSRAFGRFSTPVGRSFSARIRLIETKRKASIFFR